MTGGRVGVLGASGFVGAEVVRTLDDLSVEWRPVPRIPVPLEAGDLASSVDRLIDQHARAFAEIEAEISLCDSVVNCAGLAAPTSSDSLALWAKNVFVPAVLDRITQQCGVRLLHVSSAAAQGNVPVLDESARVAPMSPYAKSKAEAERLLIESARSDVCVYRATSVMGLDRGITQTLFRLFGGPVSPVFGSGDAPLPLASVSSTAHAIVFLATSDVMPRIALHPWEHATQRSVADALRAPGARRVRVPMPLGADRALRMASSLRAPIGPLARRVELLVTGQRQEATELATMGFAPADDLHQMLGEIARRSGLAGLP